MYRVLTALACGAILLAACEVPPGAVKTSAEVDGFILKKRYRSACVGLVANDESLQEHTARALVSLSHVRVANECLCDALYDAEKHTVQFGVGAGLAASGRDDLAECLAPALHDEAIRGPQRARVVHTLGLMEAPGAYAAIGGLLADPDPEVRARAAEALRPSKDATEALCGALANDAEPSVRAAAARALSGRKVDAAIDALVASAARDPDGEVRAAALASAVETGAPAGDDMVCAAMMDDPDERVRVSAIQQFHGAKSRSSLKCLDRRMTTPDESGAVRQALLDAVKASPSPEAADMLCRHINAWSRMYIRDKLAPDIEGHNIARAQNDRDWERSYECVQRALSQGGLSCYAKNYLGKWMRDLGGNAPTPWCPGMVKN